MTEDEQQEQHRLRWGAFSGELIVAMLGDGRNARVIDDFAYCDPDGVIWVAPEGSIVNGASVPRFFWRAVTPWVGKYRYASAVHDVYCSTRERPWRDVHRMFYRAVRCGGTGWTVATLMYLAVRWFGPRWKIEPGAAAG